MSKKDLSALNDLTNDLKAIKSETTEKINAILRKYGLERKHICAILPKDETGNYFDFFIDAEQLIENAPLQTQTP